MQNQKERMASAVYDPIQGRLINSLESFGNIPFRFWLIIQAVFRRFLARE